MRAPIAKPAAAIQSSVGSTRPMTRSFSLGRPGRPARAPARQATAGCGSAQHLAGHGVELAAVTWAADLAVVRRLDCAPLVGAGRREPVYAARPVKGEYDATGDRAFCGDLRQCDQGLRAAAATGPVAVGGGGGGFALAAALLRATQSGDRRHDGDRSSGEHRTPGQQLDAHQSASCQRNPTGEEPQGRRSARATHHARSGRLTRDGERLSRAARRAAGRASWRRTRRKNRSRRRRAEHPRASRAEAQRPHAVERHRQRRTSRVPDQR